MISLALQMKKGDVEFQKQAVEHTGLKCEAGCLAWPRGSQSTGSLRWS